MSFFKSLPFRLLLGIIIGAILGLWCVQNIDNTFSIGLMQVLICIHRLLGQFITFCVPIIILGFICPSIAKMGDSASRLLKISLIIAYTSSVGAACMSTIAGYILVPKLTLMTPKEEIPLPDALFQLDIPQIMPVITALFISIAVGLAVVWTRSKYWKNLLIEFQNITLMIVDKMIIPILPFYIATTFVTLGYNGTLSQFPIFIIAILIVIVGHYIWLFLLYFIAGVYSGKNPIEVLRHYGPAYITAIGTMSSAATLSVAINCANKSKVLRKDLVGFGIPLFANIHLCGSVLTETFFCMIISMMLYGTLPSVSTMILFIILLGIFAVGAPGVPGGTVMASLGIVISVLGFDEVGTALVIAIFALQDSFGTACNVTGDGALTLFLTGYCEKHKIKKAK